jgi:hypothetical protein
MIKRLYAFDFDGTLINTLNFEKGKLIWEKFYNKIYTYSGWWGRPESLDLTVFNIKPFPKIFSILNDAIKDDESLVIILTSRREKLRPSLQAVLDINMINVDKVDMKTIELTKGDRILEYLKKYPELEEINVYDDRDSDIESYMQTIPLIPQGIVFNIYHADKGELELISSTKNSILSIINEEIQNLIKK